MFKHTYDDDTLEAHATDRSIFRVKPNSVIFPESVEDIVSIVKEAASKVQSGQEYSHLTVRAGGTCMSGGALNTGTILNLTKHLTKIEINPKTRTANVETGAYFRDIEDAAAEHGLMFAPYTSSHRLCGIGGMLGNNASGEKSIRFGATIDNVASLEVVLFDGSVITTGAKPLCDITPLEKKVLDIYQRNPSLLKKTIGNVPKTASGYRIDKVINDMGQFDLTPIFIGAQGTLGIITKAVLRLVPKPIHTELIVVAARTLTQLAPVLAIAHEYNPESIETFDTNTFNASKSTDLPDIELVSKYTTPEDALYILLQFGEDTEQATVAQTIQCLEKLKTLSVSAHHISDRVIAEAWWRLRRGAFTAISAHSPELLGVPCIEDVIVPKEAIAELINKVTVYLKEKSIPFGFHGHIGEGSFRLIPFFDPQDPHTPQAIINLMGFTFTVTKELEGNLSADHSDGIIRSGFIKDFYGEEIYQLFIDTKRLFDPLNVFNPGKKVGGSKDVISKYMQVN